MQNAIHEAFTSQPMNHLIGYRVTPTRPPHCLGVVVPPVRPVGPQVRLHAGAGLAVAVGQEVVGVALGCLQGREKE